MPSSQPATPQPPPPSTGGVAERDRGHSDYLTATAAEVLAVVQSEMGSVNRQLQHRAATYRAIDDVTTQILLRCPEMAICAIVLPFVTVN